MEESNMNHEESKHVNGILFENKVCLCSEKCINGIGYEDKKANFDYFLEISKFRKTEFIFVRFDSNTFKK